jgi:hypothetical protein
MLAELFDEKIDENLSEIIPTDSFSLSLKYKENFAESNEMDI